MQESPSRRKRKALSIDCWTSKKFCTGQQDPPSVVDGFNYRTKRNAQDAKFDGFVYPSKRREAIPNDDTVVQPYSQSSDQIGALEPTSSPVNDAVVPSDDDDEYPIVDPDSQQIVLYHPVISPDMAKRLYDPNIPRRILSSSQDIPASFSRWTIEFDETEEDEEKDNGEGQDSHRVDHSSLHEMQLD